VLEQPKAQVQYTGLSADWERIIEAWDAKYPENPVSSVEGAEDWYENGE
jgi:hypothetical protein